MISNGAKWQGLVRNWYGIVRSRAGPPEGFLAEKKPPGKTSWAALPMHSAARRRRPLRLAVYFAFISATVVSSMRFEKPHSLSYHDETLTRRPETLVRVESKFDEAGLWLKSIDTSGSVW